MAKQQTEIDIGGIKFKGGRVFFIITILTSFVGVLWGGFEAYQRYLDMEAKINSFVSPDLSGFDKRLELLDQSSEMLTQEISMIIQEVQLVSDVANELKNDLRQDVRRVEKIVNDVEQQTKEDSRDNAQELKTTIKDIEDDMKKLEADIKEAQTELEEKIDKRIKRALENPLGAS